VQLLKNFPAFYGTWKFITVFTRSSLGVGLGLTTPQCKKINLLQKYSRSPGPGQIPWMNDVWVQLKVIHIRRVIGGDKKGSLESETVKYDCAGEGKQQL
jgi:hypothetical protein